MNTGHFKLYLRGILAVATLLACGLALATTQSPATEPGAMLWFASIGGVGALSGWLTWNNFGGNRLRDQITLFETALRCVDIAVVGIDDAGHILFGNAAAGKLAGIEQRRMSGRPFGEVFQLRSAADGHQIELDKLLSETTAGSAVRAVLRDANDGEHVLDISCSFEDSGRQSVSFLAMQDVSVPQGISLELFWQANHDALTGLINRRGFEEQLRAAIAAGGESGKQHTLLFIDLDRFKLINDSSGHAAGDEFLRQIAAALRIRVRSSDVLARLGGDEFVVLLHACPVEQALRIANAIRMEVSDFRFVWRDTVFHVGASIGLVVLSDPTASAEEVLDQADTACYAAKEGGRDQIRVFHAKPASGSARADMNMVETVQDAIERNGFRLFRQRIAGLNDDNANTRHFELLLRLVDRDGKLVPPMAFIPSAERHNMMQAIDRWVLQNAFAAIRRECDTQVEGEPLPLYDINLSAASIADTRFAQFVREQLTLHKVPPETICFEITETLAVANLVKAAELIRDLKGLGLRFALDDFGAGMCSFAYLKHLPVDYVKIDGAFVRDMLSEPMNHEIVLAINNITHSLGMQTIAEFVETEGTLNRLREMGVDLAQGYTVGRPFYFA